MNYERGIDALIRLVGLDRNLASVGPVCNLPMRRKCSVPGRLQTCPTLTELQAFRKVAINVRLVRNCQPIPS